MTRLVHWCIGGMRKPVEKEGPVAIQNADGTITVVRRYGRKGDRTWWCQTNPSKVKTASHSDYHGMCIAEEKQYDTSEQRAAICGCPCHR